MSERLPILYLAPWVGYGGSDKNTIDWFRWLDRERFAPYLVTTQPSPNPLLDQVEPYAEEVWVLPDLMPAERMPAFILDFVASRGIRAIHLMNSRIGFDLLPDLRELPAPPAVVVQMHAEETDRSGYVRYVTTRLGDLVDCFSLSNEHVAEAVRGYGIPAERTRVIYTGADADGEFDPAPVEPIEALDREQLQILFAARLVAQKDPLLMVEVAAALRDAGVPFQVQVVGEGDMEDQMRERIAALGLREQVIMHPAVPGLLRWYAACDALLLTSTFEGIPVVIFEAMAMGLPIVTPGLPAIREMLHADDEGVVLPRDSVPGYVAALSRLALDRAHLAQRSGEMRARAKGELSVQQMAASHGELYEELVAGLPQATPPPTVADGASFPVLVASELAAGLATAASPIVAATAADPAALREPQLQEKALRRFDAADESIDAIALSDAGADGRFDFRALSPDDGPAEPRPHTLIWRRDAERQLPKGLWIDPEAPVDSLTRLFVGAGARVEWRHHRAPSDAPPQPSRPPGAAWIAIEPGPAPAESAPEPAHAPHPPRWQRSWSWMPTSSLVLSRYREADGSFRIVATETPPTDDPELILGCLRGERFQGTAELLASPEGYRRLAPEDPDSETDDRLGFVELAPLPGMDSISLAVHRAGGQRLIVVHPDDPLLPEVDVIEHLGFLDPLPLRPRETPSAERPLGLRPLAKSLDLPARRHRYAVGAFPAGDPVAELGALSESELGGSIPLWIVDGTVRTDRHSPPSDSVPTRDARRWALEPLSWGELASRGARLKVAARRGAEALRPRRPRGTEPPPASPPAGWLFDAPGPGRIRLYASYHPVTRDQLLTRDPDTAAALGYERTEALGYARGVAVLGEDLGERQLAIPWARRFGHVPRKG